MRKLIFVSLLIGFKALAGGDAGGGGKGVLCVNGFQRTLISLDLYEGKNVWGYNIDHSSSIGNALAKAAPKYWEAQVRRPLEDWPNDPQYRAKVIEQKKIEYHYFVDHLQFIPAGTRLTVTPDATIYLQPPQNCQIVQIIEYVDSGFQQGAVLTDRDYWDLLSPTDKVALYYHEYQYKALRDAKFVDTSDKVRHVIGLVFSSHPYPYPYEALDDQKDIIECEAQDKSIRFFVVPLPKTPYWTAIKSILIFSRLMNYKNYLFPVEYRALSIFEPSEFVGNRNGYGSGDDILNVSSTIDFVELKLVGQQNCSGGSQSNCPIEFSVKGNDANGKPLVTPVSCSWVRHP